MSPVRFILSAVILFPLLGSVGCTKSMTPGKMQWVSADSNQSRVGNAYLLRGFLGIFSYGIDNLTKEINAQGVRAHVYQDDQWHELAQNLRKAYINKPNHEPLILIGHSYGADDVLRVASELQKDKIRVDLLVTLDPVTPPAVPVNVRRVVNIYRPNGVWDKMPWLRGIPLTEYQQQYTRLDNFNLHGNRSDLFEEGTDHFNIEKKPKIHAEILKQVLQYCPPRSSWAAGTYQGSTLGN